MWRWHGSTRRAVFSRKSGRARSRRMTSICSGSPRCSAITQCMGRCCAAITGPSTSCLGRMPTRSPASRRGFGPRTAPCRRCGPMGRWPGNSSRSQAHAAASPAATPTRSMRSSPRSAGTRSRPSSRNCVRCARFSHSHPLRALSTPPCWTPSRRCARASRPGSHRCGIRARWKGSSHAIDRGNPCGKRDYAIILLIARLGLRGIDVKRLEFGDFDWPGNRLSLTQAKTGHRVQLPLLKEVGWAVIDYIRGGRPVCDCPQVFVRHTAPIGPFSDQDHLHQILVKHARVAHVPISEKRRHGMHSLRHTLATRLMEDGTPLEQIADILGHQSVRSTGVYLKSSLGLLAKCALDPDAPAQGASR